MPPNPSLLGRLQRWLRGPASASQTIPPDKKVIRLRVTRDSVCMGDDVDAPHEQMLEVNADQDPESIIREVIRRYRLASIAGGKATWVCRVAGESVAVVAQQWRSPRFTLLPLEIQDGSHVDFIYHAQKPPEDFLG